MKTHNFNKFLESKSNNIHITLDQYLEYKDKLAPIIAYIKASNKNLYDGIDFIDKHHSEYETDSFTKNVIDSVLSKISILITNQFASLWDDITNKGYSGHLFRGAKYKDTQNMRLVDVAKLIKKELEIEFDDWKFSVSTDSYSGGQSLTVRIKDISYNPYSDYADDCFKNNKQLDLHTRTLTSNGFENKSLYNEKFEKDMKKIESIVEQYNMDDSDGQTDYFHTRFYKYIKVDVKDKFYPESEDVLRSKKWDEEYAKKRAEAKIKADAAKGEFKRGDKIYYNWEGTKLNFAKKVDGEVVKYVITIPKGEYEGIITKGTNGRSEFPHYEISFNVESGIDENGDIFKFNNARTYRSNISTRTAPVLLRKR